MTAISEAMADAQGEARSKAEREAKRRLRLAIMDDRRAPPAVTLPGVTIQGVPEFAPATPERLAKADNDNFTDEKGTRWIVEGFERMHKRGQIDDDPEMNDTLFAAGRLYQQDHHFAGLSPLGAIDYGRPMIDGGGQQLLTERAQISRDSFRKARRRMTARYAAVVDAVVLEGKTLKDIGVEFTRYADAGKAGAAAAERLNIGLRALGAHYKLLRQAA